MRDRIAAAINVIAALLLVACVALLTVQIVLRVVFNAPMTWIEEVTRYAFVWVVYLGSVVALTRGSHIRVLVLVERYGAWAQRTSDVLSWVVNVICFGFLLYWGADLAWKYKDAEFYTLPGVPQLIFYLAIPVSMAIMLAFLLVPGRRPTPGAEPPSAL